MKLKSVKDKIYFWVGICAFLFLSIEVMGIGILLPTQPEFSALELKEHNVNVEIKGNVAKTKVEHVFHNSYNRPLEATFIFPVPKNADVTDFAMWMNGKKVSGEVLEKEKARRIYEDIVRRTRDPGLLEFINSRLFRVQIFPVPPLGDQKVEIEYTQVLPTDEGLTEYYYSMRGISERAGEGGGYDYQRINSSMEMKIMSEKPLLTLYSPTHNVDQEHLDGNNIKIKADKKSLMDGKDFKLFFKSSEKNYGVSLIPYRPDKEEDGFFMMIISPKQDVKEEEIEQKAVSFVLDISGSMLNDDKIKSAKKALEFCLMSLREKDFFNVLAFSTEVKSFSEKLEPATEEKIKNAKKFIEDIRATGGTNIYEALMAALKDESPEKLLHVIVFITDGLPTIGITNPDEILRDFQKLNKKNVRIFTFGIGYDVNTHLLDLLAEKTNAISEYIIPKEDMEIKISSFFKKVQSPVLTNLKLDVENVKLSEVYPKAIPDLFLDANVLLFGRYVKEGDAKITLAGLAKSEEKKFTFSEKFPAENSENEFVEKLWGIRKIGYLLDEIRLNGESDELKNEVIRLAKKYNVVTPYTSFLVQEDELHRQIVQAPMPPSPYNRYRVNDFTEEKAARELPQSRDTIKAESARVYYNSKTPADTPIVLHKQLQEVNPNYQLVAPTGQNAVETSKLTSELKYKNVLDSENKSTVRIVGGKTFVLSNTGEWMDNEISGIKIPEAKTLKIKSFSGAYFDLLSIKPELNKIISLGDKVRFIYNGWLIIISEEGVETLPAEFVKEIRTGKK